MSAALNAEVPEGYKLTEVGVIPGDWESWALADLADLTSSKRIFGDDYVATGIPFYRGKEISQLVAGETLEDVCYITEKRYADIEARFGAPVRGDILITSVGTLGNIYRVDSDSPFYFKDGNLIWLRFIKNIDSKFLCIQLRQAKDEILAGAIGSSQKALTIVVLKKLVLAVPPPQEQRAITTALSDVDTLLAKLSQLIAKKQNLKQAAMQQLLTGQTRLPGFSGEWEVKRLGDVLSRVANGLVYEPTNSFGVPVTRIETIADGTIDLTRVGYTNLTQHLAKYKIQRGDILFSHINSIDHIGKVALFELEMDLYHGMNLLLLRPTEMVMSRFLSYWLSSSLGRKQSASLAKQAVSQASINTGELKGIEVFFPPLDEQTAIATVLSDLDAEVAALQTRHDKTRALKQGMMQALLTGRIRLL